MPKITLGPNHSIWCREFHRYTMEELLEYHQEELPTSKFDCIDDTYWWECNNTSSPRNLPPLPSFLENIYDPDMLYDGAMVHLCFSHIVHAAQFYPEEDAVAINFFNRVSRNFFNNALVEEATFRIYEYVHRCRLLGFINTLDEACQCIAILAGWFKSYIGCGNNAINAQFLYSYSKALGFPPRKGSVNQWQMEIIAWNNVDLYNKAMIYDRPYEMERYRQQLYHHLPVHLRPNYGDIPTPTLRMACDINQGYDDRSFIERFALNYTHQNPTPYNVSELSQSYLDNGIKDQVEISEGVNWFAVNEDYVLWHHRMLRERLPELRDYTERNDHCTTIRLGDCGKVGEQPTQIEQRHQQRRETLEWTLANAPNDLNNSRTYSAELGESRKRYARELATLRYEQPALCNWVDTKIERMAQLVSDWDNHRQYCIDYFNLDDINSLGYFSLDYAQAPDDSHSARYYNDYSPKGRMPPPTHTPVHTTTQHRAAKEQGNNMNRPTLTPRTQQPRGYQHQQPQQRQRPQQRRVQNDYPTAADLQQARQQSYPPLLIAIDNNLEPVLCYYGDADYDYHYQNGASEYIVENVANQQRNNERAVPDNVITRHTGAPQQRGQQRVPQQRPRQQAQPVIPEEAPLQESPRITALRAQAQRHKDEAKARRAKEASQNAAPQEEPNDNLRPQNVQRQAAFETTSQTPTPAQQEEEVVVVKDTAYTEQMVEHKSRNLVPHREYEEKLAITEYDMKNNRDIRIKTKLPKSFSQEQLIQKKLGLTIAAASKEGLLTIQLNEEQRNPVTNEDVVYLIPESMAKRYNLKPQVSPDGDVGNALYCKYTESRFFYFNAYGDVRDTVVEIKAFGEDVEVETYDAHQCNPKWMKNAAVLPDYREIAGGYGDGTMGVQHPFIINDDLIVSRDMAASKSDLFFADSLDVAKAKANAKLKSVRDGINSRLAVEYQYIQSRPFFVDPIEFDKEAVNHQSTALSRATRLELGDVKRIARVLDIDCPFTGDIKVAFNQHATELLNRVFRHNLQIDLVVNDAASTIADVPEHLENNYGTFVSSAFCTNLHRYVKDLMVFLNGDLLKDYQDQTNLIPVDEFEELETAGKMSEVLVDGETSIESDSEHPLFDDLHDNGEDGALAKQEMVPMKTAKEVTAELRAGLVVMGTITHVTELPCTSASMGLVIDETYGSCIRDGHVMYKMITSLREHNNELGTNRFLIRTVDNVIYEVMDNWYQLANSYILVKVSK